MNIFLAIIEGSGSGGEIICGDLEVFKILKFVFKILDVIFYVAPMLLIVMISLSFVKNTITQNMDNAKKELVVVIKRILSCAMLLLMPTIVSLLLSLLGTLGLEAAECMSTLRQIDLNSITIPDYESKSDEYYVTNSKTVSVTSNKKVVISKKSSKKSSSKKSSSKKSTTKQNSKSKKNIFIGDSRTCGMKMAVSSNKNDEWICKDSQGYNWFVNEAIPTLKTKLKTNKTYNIYINLGVNDFGNINSYISKYKELTKKYKNHNVVIVSVNPINDSVASSNGYMARNSQVAYFNSELKKTKGIKYCDTYTKLLNSSWKTTDGIHYETNTYKTIYNEMKKC